MRRKQPHSLTKSADRALYAKLATALFLKALRQVVDSTVGDVVQLVRTLPRQSLESYTVTDDTLFLILVSRLLFSRDAPTIGTATEHSAVNFQTNR